MVLVAFVVLPCGDVVAGEGRRLLIGPKPRLLQEDQVGALGCQPRSQFGGSGPGSVAVELHKTQVPSPLAVSLASQGWPSPPIPSACLPSPGGVVPAGRARIFFYVSGSQY